MALLTHQIEFKALRLAYHEVKNFIEEETSGKVSSIHTQIENDIGIAGADSYELIEKFVTTYNLDISGLDLSKHFHSEGALCDSGGVLLGLLSLPILLIIWLVKILTFGKIDGTQIQILPDCYRKTTDMTFGDMLTWYLTGTYNLRENVRIVLRNEI